MTAMIHVTSSCNPAFHYTGAHYINGDTTAFMQLIQGNLFKDFPTLRFVIPHGGGAVPFHWGRYRGLAQEMKKPLLKDHLLKQRVLRHLRLPPAGHRADGEGDPGRQHPVRVRDARRGEGRRSGDRPQLRRYEALHRQAGFERFGQAENLRRQRAPRLSPAGPPIKNESSHRDGRSRRHRPGDRGQGGARQAGARACASRSSSARGDVLKSCGCSRNFDGRDRARANSMSARSTPEHGLAALDAARTAIRVR